VPLSVEGLWSPGQPFRPPRGSRRQKMGESKVWPAPESSNKQEEKKAQTEGGSLEKPPGSKQPWVIRCSRGRADKKGGPLWGKAGRDKLRRRAINSNGKTVRKNTRRNGHHCGKPWVNNFLNKTLGKGYMRGLTN